MNLISRFLLRLRFKRSIKSDESVNVVDSMVKARRLYRELSIAAHPDKHPDKIAEAEDLMQRITASKHSYTELLSLKQEVETKLM